MGIDPAISLLNYQICGAKYRAATSWFVGRDVPAREYLGYAEYDMTDEEFWNWYPHARDEIEAELANRSGLEFLKGGTA
jgi:hypothetical protein